MFISVPYAFNIEVWLFSQQLNDSSMIISTLSTYLKNRQTCITEITQYYPTMTLTESDSGKKTDVVNKYHVMLANTDQNQIDIDK